MQHIVHTELRLAAEERALLTVLPGHLISLLESVGEVYGPAAPEKILYQIYQSQTAKLKAKLTGARDRVPQKTYVMATGYKNDTFAPMAEKLRNRQGWRVEEMPYTHDLQHVAVTETADMIESAIP